MDEGIKRDLLKAVQENIERFDHQKAQILKNKVNIEVLSNLVAALEENPANLKLYTREALTKILSAHQSNEVIQKTLNKLEIARLVISLQDRGVAVSFNEEELNILIEFLEVMRGLRDAEIQKFQQIVDTDVRNLDEKMGALAVIKEKISAGEKGSAIINKQEIDNIMHIVIEKEADDRLQISVLRLLNRINIGIYTNSFSK